MIFFATKREFSENVFHVHRFGKQEKWKRNTQSKTATKYFYVQNFVILDAGATTTKLESGRDKLV